MGTPLSTTLAKCQSSVRQAFRSDSADGASRRGVKNEQAVIATVLEVLRAYDGVHWRSVDQVAPVLARLIAAAICSAHAIALASGAEYNQRRRRQCAGRRGAAQPEKRQMTAEIALHPYARAAMIAEQIALLLAGESDEDIQRFALAHALVLWAWRGHPPSGASFLEIGERDAEMGRLTSEVFRAESRLERERKARENR
jgi:hypothetical protein